MSLAILLNELHTKYGASSTYHHAFIISASLLDLLLMKHTLDRRQPPFPLLAEELAFWRHRCTRCILQRPIHNIDVAARVRTVLENPASADAAEFTMHRSRLMHGGFR